MYNKTHRFLDGFCKDVSGGIRTPDRSLRRRMLYPAELLLTINNQALEIKELQSKLKTVIDKNVENLVEAPKKAKTTAKAAPKTTAKKSKK